MSKRNTPAQSAASKRAAFAGQRQSFSVARSASEHTHRKADALARANYHGHLMALCAGWNRPY